MPYKDPEKQSAWKRKWRAAHRKEQREYMRSYRLEHREEQRKYGREWYAEHCEDRREYLRTRKAVDMNFRLACNLRNRLYSVLKQGYKSGSAIADLGCSIDDLKSWLEQNFKPGMSWDNYGEWHIDHIVPLSSVDLTDRKQLKKVCHWFNLQPLWADENLSKGSRC